MPAARKPSRSRIVRYGYERAGDGPLFDERAMERLLASALARGVLTAYDTGRGACVWLEGPPGADLRAVREQVRAMLPSDVGTF